MANPSTNAKRKRGTVSATRRSPSQTKKKSADTPLFNGSHINGFIVGVMTGAIASLGIVAGINPSALPAAIAPSTEGTVESTRQPSFTFFTTLEDESFSVDAGRSLDSGPSEYTQYVLQAGSFRAVADADRRRGELALPTKITEKRPSSSDSNSHTSRSLRANSPGNAWAVLSLTENNSPGI